MIKTLIIYNTKQSSSAKESVNILRQVLCPYGDVDLIDLASERPLHEYFFEIKNHQADLYITYELAGFELKTEADKSSYNIIYGRFFHIITKQKEAYPSLCEIENNLAHYIYSLEGVSSDDYTLAIKNLLSEAELI